ncbi:MAG: hypothetical protein EOL98_15595 [Negativicutes bacterium]|nr:hypothetical protein [Negativicutes bacterium]
MSDNKVNMMNLYLIGSGFTKAIFPKSPLNNELLKVLVSDRPDCAAQWLIDKYKTNDVEIALTKLDVDIRAYGEENTELISELKGLRRDIERDIGKFFSFYRATPELLEEKVWLKELLQFVSSNGNVAVSLNYDSVFEGALDCIGRWSPKGGYGPFQHGLIDDSEYDESPIAVLKIHGSTTFKIAESINALRSRAVNFLFDEYFFPVSAKDKHFGYGLGKGETYLIAPSFVKIPTVEMSYCMIDALKAASKSRNLIVVGCGLRLEDSFLTILLTHFLHQRDWQKRKIIIVDPYADKIASRIREYWGVNVDKCIVSIEEGIEESIKRLQDAIV